MERIVHASVRGGRRHSRPSCHADSHSWTLTGQPPRSGFALAHRGLGLGLGLALGHCKTIYSDCQLRIARAVAVRPRLRIPKHSDVDSLSAIARDHAVEVACSNMDSAFFSRDRWIHCEGCPSISSTTCNKIDGEARTSSNTEGCPIQARSYGGSLRLMGLGGWTGSCMFLLLDLKTAEGEADNGGRGRVAKYGRETARRWASPRSTHRRGRRTREA